MSKRRKKILKQQINQKLNELDCLGHSRNKAKTEMKIMGAYNFGDTPKGIYSIKTKENYRQVLTEFTHYCTEQKKESPRADLEKLIEKHGKDYLEHRIEKGYSVSTVGRDRAALNKVAQTKIEINLITRSIHDIKRSRNNTNQTSKNFSEERNKDLVSFAKGTGGRREDLSKLTKESFYEKNSRLFVRFEQSKGGKSRIAVVREEYREDITERLKMTPSGQKVFVRIHKHADIHSYRRNYAQNLYSDVISDKQLNKDLTALYPKRDEDIKSHVYTTKGQDNIFQGRRDDVHLITQSLGHNRLDIAVNHYLR